MHNPLSPFIEHARSKGMDHATIRLLLLSAGWKEKDIAQAMANQGLDMPVPVPADKGGAREAFLHLLAFSSLYTTVISLIVLFFTYLNLVFPDAAVDYYNTMESVRGTIRWSIACIIITYPLFIWLTRILLTEMREHPERAWSGIRRWLTYLTLFITALALIGDGVTLIFQLLDGELSVRFITKVLVVAVLAGMTFSYYFLALRTPKSLMNRSFHRNYAAIATLITLGALVWGFVIAGSPMSERLRKFDERRVNDLMSIQSEIMSMTVHYMNSTPVLRYELPKTLEEVRDAAQYQRPSIVDPETAAPYEYERLTRSTYRLCATFNMERKQQYDIRWDHPAGHHCYDFDALDDTRGPKPVPPIAEPVPAPVK